MGVLFEYTQSHILSTSGGPCFLGFHFSFYFLLHLILHYRGKIGDYNPYSFYLRGTRAVPRHAQAVEAEDPATQEEAVAQLRTCWSFRGFLGGLSKLNTNSGDGVRMISAQSQGHEAYSCTVQAWRRIVDCLTSLYKDGFHLIFHDDPNPDAVYMALYYNIHPCTNPWLLS